jgi:hypothetical protein
LTELLPEDNALRRGFEEGAESAREAAASKKLEVASAAPRRSIEAKKKPAPAATSTEKPKQRKSLPKPRKARV